MSYHDWILNEWAYDKDSAAIILFCCKRSDLDGILFLKKMSV